MTDRGWQTRRAQQRTQAAERQREHEDRVLDMADRNPDDPYLQEVAQDVRDHREMAEREADQRGGPPRRAGYTRG